MEIANFFVGGILVVVVLIGAFAIKDSNEEIGALSKALKEEKEYARRIEDESGKKAETISRFERADAAKYIDPRERALTEIKSIGSISYWCSPQYPTAEPGLRIQNEYSARHEFSLSAEEMKRALEGEK